jgi:hypothetical protein
VRDWLPTRRVGIDRLLRFYDELWFIDTPLDTVTALAHAERLRSDTSLGGRYPVDEFVWEAICTLDTERRRAVKSPAGGTFQLDVSINDGPPRPLFLRVAATPTTLGDVPRAPGDSSLSPPTPAYDTRQATSTARPDGRAPGRAPAWWPTGTARVAAPPVLQP